MAKGSIKPVDLVDSVKALLDEHQGKWTSPQALWETIQQRDPDLAEQVEAKVRTYADPERTNAVWFLSNTLYHVGKDPRYELSDIEKVPAMKGQAFWLIARAID